MLSSEEGDCDSHHPPNIYVARNPECHGPEGSQVLGIWLRQIGGLFWNLLF